MDSELSQELDSQGVMTPEKFSLEVERRVREEGEAGSYIAATSEYFEELDVDAEDGLKLISPTLLDKIKNEALDKNLLKEKRSTSSIF